MRSSGPVPVQAVRITRVADDDRARLAVAGQIDAPLEILRLAPLGGDRRRVGADAGAVLAAEASPVGGMTATVGRGDDEAQT